LGNINKTEKIDPGRQRWTKQTEKYKTQEEHKKSANIRGLKVPMHKWEKIMAIPRIFVHPIYDCVNNIYDLYFLYYDL
jgi:hypothetical protein